MPTAAADVSYSQGPAETLIHDTSWKGMHLAGSQRFGIRGCSSDGDASELTTAFPDRGRSSDGDAS